MRIHTPTTLPNALLSAPNKKAGPDKQTSAPAGALAPATAPRSSLAKPEAAASKLVSGLATPNTAGKPPVKRRVAEHYKKYVLEFVAIAAEYGVDLRHMYREDLVIVDMPKSERRKERPEEYVAFAKRRDQKGVQIHIDPDKFFSPTRSEYGRKYVIFHELAHDVLNFDHSRHVRGVTGLPRWKVKGPLLMMPTTYGRFFSSDGNLEKQKDFLRRKLEGAFEHYRDGASDEVEDIIRRHCEQWGLERVLLMQKNHGRRYTRRQVKKIKEKYFSATGTGTGR